MKELGLHKVHVEGALFSYVKKGKLCGLVVSHVDDLLMAGNEEFEREVERKLSEFFKLSKIETGIFRYCGCRISIEEDGSIKLDQNEYADKLEKIEIMEGQDENREVTAAEQKQIRGKIGEMLWISLMTRPDLAFEVNRIAGEITKATVKTLKEINSLISRTKNRKVTMVFPRLGDVEKMRIKVFTDASFNNVEDKIKSTEGRVIVAENEETRKLCVLSWKTKKIPRVCRSVKSAETRSLDDGLDDAIHTARVIKEVYSGEINLKEPKQIPVFANIDSKSLWESLHNTRQCEEKLLRSTIAGIKELMTSGNVTSIDWVSTSQQLADSLTKKGTLSKADWLLDVASKNRL